MKQLPNTTNSKGFTLIELMVVIAIIAILSVVGLVIFSGTQRSARDSRRQSDIVAIAKALETRKVANSVIYSTIAATDFAGGSVPVDTTTAKYVIAESTTSTPPGLPTTWLATDVFPTAPAGYAVFNGTIGATTQSWRICARQENGTNVFYCLTNQQ